MPVSTVCSCGRTLKAKDEWAGKQAKCPQCGRSVTIPHAESTPQKKAGGESRFLVVVASIGLVVLAGGMFLAKTTIDSRKRAEATAKVHDSLTGAIQAANSAILKKDFTGAANGLRQAIQPRPVVEPATENEKLLAEAEATLKASEVAATDAKTFEYLGSLDDAALRQGRFELAAQITDAEVRKVIERRVGQVVPQVQANRERIAGQKREQELAIDFPYQKNLMMTWMKQQIASILEADSEARMGIWKMEQGYVTGQLVTGNLTRRGIEEVLDKWGSERETKLEERTKLIGGMLQEMTQNVLGFRVWQIGTNEEKMGLADEVGLSLKDMVKSLVSPVEDRLSPFKKSFGDRAERSSRQLDDLNRQIRQTAQTYSDLFNNRLPSSP